MYVYNVTEQEHFLRREKGFQMELQMGDEPPQKRYYKHVLLKEISKAIAFLGLILISADFVVSHAVSLSETFKIPQILVGMTVIALGVTLPELAVDLSALRAREEEIIWGDLIGSFITELTLVLGVVAIFAAPTAEALDFSQALVGYVFMAISFLLVFFFTYSKKCLTKAEGIALILLYVIFLSLQFDMLLFKTV
jgi:cation:H+ antiporter